MIFTAGQSMPKPQKFTTAVQEDKIFIAVSLAICPMKSTHLLFLHSHVAPCACQKANTALKSTKFRGQPA